MTLFTLGAERALRIGRGLFTMLSSLLDSLRAASTLLRKRLSSLLPLADRLALRMACTQYAGAVTFCGLRLPVPLPARHARMLRPLCMRPAVHKLEFVQDGCSRLEKRALKRVLKALQIGAELMKRRFEVRLVLGAPLSAADLAWLQSAFAGAGLLERCASFELVCTEAALGNSFSQVAALKLTVERLGSACKGLRSGVYRNLESLTVTGVMREEDVQDVLAAVGVAHLPGLRSLYIEAASEPEGGNARPIVVGCRGAHPDLSQLATLGMAPSINLCVNFLRYLSSLPSLSLSEGLQRAVDAYLGRRQSLMFVLMFGHHEEEQHGFLAGDLIIQFEANLEEGGEESDENE
ncbi:hypothetical protein WJX81_002758 [Elliptochloris bilobata]|uniref:Uncharacterized protein n=1 Tax=Elliptochloris bilobata TaxID=381761 RepID=A0AAW1S338_9CHLO